MSKCHKTGSTEIWISVAKILQASWKAAGETMHWWLKRTLCACKRKNTSCSRAYWAYLFAPFFIHRGPILTSSSFHSFPVARLEAALLQTLFWARVKLEHVSWALSTNSELNAKIIQESNPRIGKVLEPISTYKCLQMLSSSNVFCPTH